MKRKVLKFGGSSLGTPESIQQVLEIILDTRKDCWLAIVASACHGVTDLLIETAQKAAESDITYVDQFKQLKERHLQYVKTLIPGKVQYQVIEYIQTSFEELKDTIHGIYLVKKLSFKILDFIMSFGERLSAYILSEYLKSQNIPAEYLDTRDLVKTDNRFGSAKVRVETTYKNIQSYFNSHQNLQVMTGFIGSTDQNETTTLGRGGSDYTATLFGSALEVDEVEIWTDVDGVMTADPKKVKKAFPIISLSCEEAMEMSHFGAKVIHPPSMHPASRCHIPLRIRNTFNPEFSGTLIGERAPSAFLVKGITSIDETALIRVQGSGMVGVVGIANRLFGALAKQNINVILISQASSEHSICFSVDPHLSEAAKAAIKTEFSLEIKNNQVDPVIIEKDRSIIAIVGENMRQTPGIASRAFQALGKNGVNIVAIAQGSSELNISIVISKQDESKALNALHDAFFLSGTKTLHLFVIGTGLIGGTLLKQIEKQRGFLSGQYALDTHVAAIGNIDGMLFDEEGIPLGQWESLMQQSNRPMNTKSFRDMMLEMNLPNSIFVDCTGSEEIVTHYKSILDASISIVTPNKLANSGNYVQYRNLHDAANRHGVKFLYETNVGAGLPVISTLNDLMTSGDRILKIEAILSGTLSFIFNSFQGDRPFSGVVKEAMQRGLAEPDPRDDLNGLDVARKILILARETGLELEPKDIVLENILPQSCQEAESVDLFFQTLEKLDPKFETRRKHAADKDCVLRYIATLEDEKATVSLQEVDNSHPFFLLSGSDNMIVFTTERYKERPLVVKGPGAGAEVTAAGVFADIIRIANYLT